MKSRSFHENPESGTVKRKSDAHMEHETRCKKARAGEQSNFLKTGSDVVKDNTVIDPQPLVVLTDCRTCWNKHDVDIEKLLFDQKVNMMHDEKSPSYLSSVRHEQQKVYTQRNIREKELLKLDISRGPKDNQFIEFSQQEEINSSVQDNLKIGIDLKQNSKEVCFQGDSIQGPTKYDTHDEIKMEHVKQQTDDKDEMKQELKGVDVQGLVRDSAYSASAICNNGTSTNVNGYPHVCNTCQAGFYSREALAYHMSLNHPLCALCATGFLDKVALMDHILKQHSSDEPDMGDIRQTVKAEESTKSGNSNLLVKQESHVPHVEGDLKPKPDDQSLESNDLRMACFKKQGPQGSVLQDNLIQKQDVKQESQEFDPSENPLHQNSPDLDTKGDLSHRDLIKDSSPQKSKELCTQGNQSPNEELVKDSSHSSNAMSEDDVVDNYMFDTNHYPHRCDKCSAGFDTGTTLSSHMSLHIDDTLCLICKAQFLNRDGVMKHTHEKHTSYLPLRCEMYHMFTDGYKKTFKQKTELVTHLKSHQVNRYEFSCLGCGLRFKTIGAFSAHGLSCPKQQKTLHALNLNMPTKIINITRSPQNISSVESKNPAEKYLSVLVLGSGVESNENVVKKSNTGSTLEGQLKYTPQPLNSVQGISCEKCQQNFNSLKNLYSHFNGGQCTQQMSTPTALKSDTFLERERPLQLVETNTLPQKSNLCPDVSALDPKERHARHNLKNPLRIIDVKSRARTDLGETGLKWPGSKMQPKAIMKSKAQTNTRQPM